MIYFCKIIDEFRFGHIVIRPFLYVLTSHPCFLVVCIFDADNVKCCK